MKFPDAATPIRPGYVCRSNSLIYKTTHIVIVMSGTTQNIWLHCRLFSVTERHLVVSGDEIAGSRSRPMPKRERPMRSDNQLLRQLDATTSAKVAAALSPVLLQQHQELAHPHQTVDKVYSPTAGSSPVWSNCPAAVLSRPA